MMLPMSFWIEEKSRIAHTRCAIPVAVSFYDRFYKGRPIASLTTRNSSGRTLVLVRVKNTSSYDIVVQSTFERRGFYFLPEDSIALSIIKGQLGKDGLPPRRSAL